MLGRDKLEPRRLNHDMFIGYSDRVDGYKKVEHAEIINILNNSQVEVEQPHNDSSSRIEKRT